MLTGNDYLLAAHAIADREDTDSAVRLLATIIASIRDVLPQGEHSAVGQTFDAMVSRLASLGLTAQILSARAPTKPAQRFRPVIRSNANGIMFAVHDTTDGCIAPFHMETTAREVAREANNAPEYAMGFAWYPIMSTDTLTEI